MHALQVAADGLGAERHGAIHPRADPGGTSAHDVAAEAGRDFNGSIDVVALQSLFKIGIIGERRFLDEITRSSQFLEIGAAFMALVVVEHCEGEIVDVVRNAETEYQHQQRRAEQGEPEPDRVAQEFQGLADRVGEQALQAEQGTRRRWRSRRIGGFSRRGRDLGRGSARSCRLFEIADEGVLERGDAAGLDELRRRAGGEHASRIHERYSIAARGLVHEVGRDENGHALIARKIDQRFPEPVPRHGIDARGRLVEDEDLGLVDDGDGQRKPLANPQRQIQGALIEIIFKAEPFDQLGDARLCLLRRQVEKVRVKLEVLPDRELGIERERL